MTKPKPLTSSVPPCRKPLVLVLVLVLMANVQGVLAVAAVVVGKWG